MKRLFYSFFIITGTLLAQAPNIDWQKNIGGSNDDYGYTITSDQLGNIIIGTASHSNNGDFNQNLGGLDVWVLKYNSQGDLLWKKQFGGSASDYITDIIATNDGGYLFAGNTDSTDGGINQNYGESDFWVVKLDADGNIQWQNTYGGSGFDDVSKIIKTPTGEYFLIGHSTSNDGIFTNNNGDYDVALLKIDPNGNYLWSHLVGSAGVDFGIDGLINDVGEIVINTYTYNPDTNDSNVFVYGLDPSGLLIWSWEFGGSGSDQSNYLTQLPNGNYLIGMNSNSTDGAFEVNFGNLDVWIFEFGMSGEIFQKLHFGGSDSETPVKIDILPNGNYLVACRSNSQDGDISNNHGNGDFWVFETTPTGTIVWEKSYGGSENDGLWDMEFVLNGIYLIGESSSNNGDLTGNNGWIDAWLVKLGYTMGLEDLQTKNLIVFPNPAKDKIRVQTDLKIDSYQILDFTGKVIQQNQSNSTSKSIDIGQLPKGTYVLQIQSGNQKFQEKFIKQ
jgi:hypothetical protein